MKHKITVLLLLGIWWVLALAAWFSPETAISVSERRPLAQKPALHKEALLSGEYMGDFERYTLDQFPLRDAFRRLKSMFHYTVLNQSDNNDIYLTQGSAVQQEYPLNEDSILHAASQFQSIYERYLKESKIYFAVIPDKGHYLARESGHLTLDYERLTELLQQQIPWAQHLDLSQTLGPEDYYRTDTHWRQEQLFDTAETLCAAMGAEVPDRETYRVTELEQPFYGVYYGQAALPMEPDVLRLLESDMLTGCRVYDYETGKILPVYDMTKLSGRDLYEVYLSGSKSLLTIENPNASTDRELIIFRDSFGSAIAPLLAQGYAKITLVDVRYIQSSMLPRYMDFHGQDVLFLYSTLVLNNSESIK